MTPAKVGAHFWATGTPSWNTAPGSLHSAFQPPQLGCDVILELEAPLLEPFEHLVGGRFFVRLNAVDLSIDLIVAGRKLPKLVIALFQPRDE